MTHANDNESSPTDRTARTTARAAVLPAVEAVEPTELEPEKASLLGDTPRWVADTTALGDDETSCSAFECLRSHARNAYLSSVAELFNAVNRGLSDGGETVAIDIIAFDKGHWRETEPDPQKKEQPVRNFSHRKPHLAIAATVSTPVPIVLSIEPLAAVHGFEAENCPDPAKIAQNLLSTVEEHVAVESVLADRGFSTAGVVAELDSRELDYSITAKAIEPVVSAIEQAENTGPHDPVVAGDTIFTDQAGRETAAHVVTSPNEAFGESGEYTSFITNRDAALKAPEAIAEQQQQRWDAEHLCWLFRRRFLEKSIYQTALPLRQCWSISAEINTYQLAMYRLAAEPAAEASVLAFGRFQEVLQAERYRRAMEATGGGPTASNR